MRNIPGDERYRWEGALRVTCVEIRHVRRNVREIKKMCEIPVLSHGRTMEPVRVG